MLDLVLDPCFIAYALVSFLVLRSFAEEERTGPEVIQLFFILNSACPLEINSSKHRASSVMDAINMIFFERKK